MTQAVRCYCQLQQPADSLFHDVAAAEQCLQHHMLEACVKVRPEAQCWHNCYCVHGVFAEWRCCCDATFLGAPRQQ